MNGLFGTSHALDASVSYPATETISHGLRQLVSDVLVLIGGSCFYHIEAEMRYGKELVIRVFEYDVADAIQRRVFRDGKMHLKFPQTRIICWEARSSTPDRAVMSIEFPDGGTYDYSVEIFKFTDYDVGELEARRMILLLPFCLLRLRSRVEAAKTSEERAALAAEVLAMLGKISAAVKRAVAGGFISDNDAFVVIDIMEGLYSQLYCVEYSEFKEADFMTTMDVPEELWTNGERLRMQAMQEGREEYRMDVVRSMLSHGIAASDVADISGLPLDTVRALAV